MPSMINEVFAGNRNVSWENSDEGIQFAVEVRAGEKILIRLRYYELGEVESAEKLNYRARTMLRRYLCELRDNYIHKLSSSSSNGN